MNQGLSRPVSKSVELPHCAVTLTVIVMSVGCNQNADEAAYRTIEESFSIRRSQGWELTKAPEDERRYRVCGATESGHDPNRRSFSGEFRTGDRIVPFEVTIPEGKMVAVEGLKPIKGGPLTYAVLEKCIPANESPQAEAASTQFHHNELSGDTP